MRRLAPDRNEMRRTSDRIEAWCALVLIIAFVPLTVLSACYAASWAHARGMKEQRAESLRQVTAVLLRAVPAGNATAAGSAVIEAPARWTLAGSTHVGEVEAIRARQRARQRGSGLMHRGTLSRHRRRRPR